MRGFEKCSEHVFWNFAINRSHLFPQPVCHTLISLTPVSASYSAGIIGIHYHAPHNIFYFNISKKFKAGCLYTEMQF